MATAPLPLGELDQPGLTPVTSHTHYCAEHDLRWVCPDAPCIRHDAAPCAEDARPASPLPLAEAYALGDALATAVESALGWPEGPLDWATCEANVRDTARAWRAARAGR